MTMSLLKVVISLALFTNPALAENCESNTIAKELSELSCDSKKIHLTFDDGPDPLVTPIIGRKLKERGVQGSFYVSTTNLRPGERNDVLLDLMKQGHLIASHGHQHHPHDLRLIKTKDGHQSDPNGLSAKESEKEIALSFKLLNDATDGKYSKQEFNLFRFPYGRGASPSAQELQLKKTYGEIAPGRTFKGPVPKDENYAVNLNEYRSFRSEALQRVHANGADHVGWNYDSHDSSSEVAHKAKADPDWYTKKVLKEICSSRKNTIMALFHDRGKSFNATTIGDIIDAGRCLGAKFVGHKELLKDKDFLVNTGVLQEAPKLDGEQIEWAIRNIASSIDPNSSAPICEGPDLKDKGCLSSNGRTYGHCQGEDSVCVHGRWKSKSDPIVNKVCFRSCYSEYAKKTYQHCEGEDSICVNGKWESKTSEAAKRACNQ